MGLIVENMFSLYRYHVMVAKINEKNHLAQSAR